MTGIALFVQDLGAFPALRARNLHTRMLESGLPGVDAVYALVWPDYQPPVRNIPGANRQAFADWRSHAGLPLWAWVNASADQAADAAAISALEQSLRPDGWLLDIEGEWTKGAKLSTLLSAAAATGRPRRASLAGATASHVEYDYRTLDRQGYDVDWQAYFDSGEGPTPADAVRELYQSSFVISGWEYRARIGSAYGWGKVTLDGRTGVYDAYRDPGKSNAFFPVMPRDWGATVASRDLWKPPDGTLAGLLMGRAEYAHTRVTLDVTRTAQSRPAAEWVSIAAGARIPGARKRPVSVYLAENASDEVLLAIARGAS